MNERLIHEAFMSEALEGIHGWLHRPPSTPRLTTLWNTSCFPPETLRGLTSPERLLWGQENLKELRSERDSPLRTAEGSHQKRANPQLTWASSDFIVFLHRAPLPWGTTVSEKVGLGEGEMEEKET